MLLLNGCVTVGKQIMITVTVKQHIVIQRTITQGHNCNNVPRKSIFVWLTIILHDDSHPGDLTER